MNPRWTAYLITYCPARGQLYGNTPTLRTFRRGFPTAELIVIDNGSEAACWRALQLLVAGARASRAHTVPERPHWQLLEQIFEQASGPVAIIDPDIAFFTDVEQWPIRGLVAGRRMPAFFDSYTRCWTHPRLHTSLLMIPSAERLKSAIAALQEQWIDLQPCRPVMVPTPRGMERWDTGAALTECLGAEAQAFTDEQLEAFAHLFCGTHFDLVAPGLLPEVAEAMAATHRAASEGRYEELRGIHRSQDAWLARLGKLTAEEKQMAQMARTGALQ